jgi:hypothetical protein
MRFDHNHKINGIFRYLYGLRPSFKSTDQV